MPRFKLEDYLVPWHPKKRRQVKLPLPSFVPCPLVDCLPPRFSDLSLCVVNVLHASVSFAGGKEPLCVDCTEFGVDDVVFDSAPVVAVEVQAQSLDQLFRDGFCN